MRALAFASGLAALLAVLTPPFDDLADRSFAWHMGQHLVLALVVPPLILLADPVRAVLRRSPRRIGRALARLLQSGPVRLVSHPLPAWLFFVGTLWGTHFSPLYDLALDSEPVHALEHGLYLTSALLFWGVALGTIPWGAPLPYPVRAFFVFLAMPFSAFLGLAIFSANHVLYAHYRALGEAALADQRDGGELMWLGGGLLMFVAFMGLIAAWARAEMRAEQTGHAA